MNRSTGERRSDRLRSLGSNPKVSMAECSTSKRIHIEEDVSECEKRKTAASPALICLICCDEKQTSRIMSCRHSYCSDCVAKHVASKLQDNVSRICCVVSRCEGVLEPENCRSILPKEVFDRWGDALFEAMFLDFEKFCCPFEDCSAVLIDEKLEVVESECPECRRLFCAKCKVPWHSEISCSNFQKLHHNKRLSEEIGAEEVYEYETKKTTAPTLMCEICCDEKQMTEIFRITGCNHSYCSECVSKYVDSKLQDNISQIHCPDSGCQGLLEPENCRLVMPKPVFDRWVDALCEAMILSSEKFYCPFKDCSALLIDEKQEVVESECPECRRLFCAKCKVPWHSDISCSEYQNLHKDERQREDLQLMKFAKGKEWKRCPNCRIYVERISGCTFMGCRCGCTFCYTCGSPAKDHFCRNCGLITR